MNQMRNKVSLIGRLGVDPEVKETANGRKMARMVVATSEYYKDADGERKENTQWHNLVAWGRIAERAEMLLGKGLQVAVEGKLNNRSFEDKEGNTKYVTEVVVSDFLLLDTKEKAES